MRPQAVPQIGADEKYHFCDGAVNTTGVADAL